MPSSRHEHISDVVSAFLALSPRSVLDIGCGFGRWGFLAREFCDVSWERYAKTTWKTRVDAVEAFEDYISPHHRYIYDNIYVARVQDFIEEMDSYDLICMGDVLEHLEKKEGIGLLHDLRGKCSKGLIVGVPLGERWPQGAVLGNPFEEHLSVWTRRDLCAQQASHIRVYRVPDGRNYAVAVWSDCTLPMFPPTDLLDRITRLRGMLAKPLRRLVVKLLGSARHIMHSLFARAR